MTMPSARAFMTFSIISLTPLLTNLAAKIASCLSSNTGMFNLANINVHIIPLKSFGNLLPKVEFVLLVFGHY